MFLLVLLSFCALPMGYISFLQGHLIDYSNSLRLNYVMLCRNHILGVWNKDVGRILRLEDFDVSDTPLVGESPRVSLMRDIFTFLDQYVSF